MGRASFYRNFASKEAVLQRQDEVLLRQWQKDYDAAARQDAAAGREPVNLMVSLLLFYKEHRDFYTLVYRNDSRILLDTILKVCGLAPEDANAVAYTKAFIAYGIYGAVSEWIGRGMTESAEELARHDRIRRGAGRPDGPEPAAPTPGITPRYKKSRPADMCGWAGHIQGNLAQGVCEPQASARFCAKFCPQGDIRGKEFLPRDCAQKWVPPKAHRTLRRIKTAHGL